MATPPHRSAARPAAVTPERLALLQGGYFAVTGVWPILHMRSFEAVTGPKTDRWLVRTVGAVLGVVGATLLSAGRARRVSPEIRGLALGSAAALAAVDVVHVARRRIPPVYLLDAAAEVALVGAWAWSGRSAVRAGVRRGRLEEEHLPVEVQRHAEGAQEVQPQ